MNDVIDLAVAVLAGLIIASPFIGDALLR